MGSYSDYRKKKKEEVLGASSEKISGGTYGEYAARKRIGFDTLESDLNTLGSTISNVYNGWQDADTMSKTRTSVEDMQKRLGSYQEYQKKYGGADLSDIASGYQSVLDDWDNLSSVYGYYQNADAYNSAVKKSKMDKDFGGLSYDDVQSKLKEYKEGSDEHKYLSEYMGYSDLRDFDKALSSAADGDYKEKLQAERNKYALDNNFDLYKDYLNAEDYEENSKYKGSPYKGPLGGLWDRIVSAEADVYEHAGQIQKAREKYGETYEEGVKMLGYDKPMNAGLGSMPEGMMHATDEELGVYFQIANTEGLDKALDYARSMEVTWSKRSADNEVAREQEWLESGNGVTRKLKQGVVSALSVPTSLVGKVEGAVDDVGNLLTGQELNPYNDAHRLMNSTQNVQNVTRENIEEYTEENDWVGTDVPLIGNVWSSLYGDAMSIGENALGAAALGPAYGYVASAGAFTTRAKELKEAGATDEQIRNGAIASAVFEYIGENIGLDNLFKIKNVDSLGKFLKNIPGQMLTEGGEEMFTEFMNIAGDFINRGAMSDAAQKYQEYLDRGFSKEEAWKNTAADLGSQIAKAGVSGAFSGAVMGGGYGGIQYYNNAKTGQTIRDNNAVADLQGIANGLNNDAYADYLKLIEGNNISNAKLGNLYTELNNEVSENLAKEKANAQMRPMADRAIELGDTKNSGMIASAVTKHLNGEKLSAEEKAMLKTDTAQTILADTKRGDIQVKATDSFNKAMDNATKMRNIVEMPIDEKARRSRVAELNVGEVTEVTSTGNSTKIDGIRVEDGSTIVLTSEGEVKAEDMTFSAKDAEMLSYAENMSPDKANLFLSQYDGKVDVEDYRNSFNMAYSYGEVGFAADTVLKNKGVLTEVQASEIYKQSLKMASDRKQKVIDEINEKQKGNTFVKGTFDDSIISYKGNTTDKNKVSWSKLTPQQRSAITFAKGFSKATGVNIKFIKSNVVNGEHKGKNGSYNPSTNTIEIDVYAGRIDAKSITDSIVPTLSHEVTHWMKAKTPAMYNKMKEHIAETLAMNDGKTIEQRVDDEMVRMKSARSKMNVTPEMAIDEIIARSCEDMLSNSEKARELLNGLTKAEQNDLVSKIKDTFKNLIKWVNDLLNTYKSNSEEAKILREYESRLKELSKMWDEALTKAIESNQSLQHEGKTGEQAIGENIFTENTAQLSIRTYENEGRELLHKWLKNSDLDKKTKKDIIEQMDYVYDVATKYAADNDLIDFASWSESDVIRRDDGTPILTVVVPNGDYPLNIDFSQICKKRKALNSVLNALVRSGDLDVRTLSQSDIGNINRIIKEHGFEIACALCFVDSKRYRVNEWADSFTDTYNKLVKSLTKGTEYKADEFNYTGRNVKQPDGKLLKDANDSELNFDYINEVLAKNSSGKAIYRYALAIKNNKELRSTLNSSEIISSAGLDAIKVQNETLYGLVNSHQGSAKPKLSHSENPYGYEILLDSKFNPEDAYKVGGIRIQSFSDYMANMFFDYVQMIGDLSAKRLPAHAYTKEYYFAKLFGLTGIKINLSIVPKGADITDEQKTRFNKMTKAAKEKDAEFKKLKAHAGLDENGNYILEDETFPLDKALELQNTEGYDKNCGIIWVGVSDAHIEKMLNDDNVPYIIPYHKSSLNPAIARMRNIDFYNDYTKAQNTRYDTKAKKKVPASIWSFDFYADLAKTNDPKQTAENYKKECAERGYLPKFDQFADNPNYYKLLVDFRVYDKAGNYAPQSAVQMKFPNDFNEIVGESLVEAQDTQKRLDADMKDLLDEIRSELKLGHEQYSDRDSDGNTLTKGQMEYFKDSKVRDGDGNLRVVYHGSEADFTVFDRTKTRANMDIQGSFFSPWDIDAGGYGGKVRAFYLNIKNPASESMGYKALNKFKGQNGAGIKAREYLESLGYDGVNNGDEEYIAFYPEQIKLVANENPTEDADIRYSDRDYMDAVNRGDMETAQKMVDEVAKDKGYSEKVYHGTKAEFTIFKQGLSGGIYMATNRKVADEFARGGSVKALYTKFENPMVVNALIPPADVWGGYKMPFYYEIPTPKEMLETGKYGETVATEEISVYAQRKGYDGVIIHNMKESYGLGTSDYIAFKPNQIKSADPVTYDDNGNVIPLSQRFNTEDDDIRYSDRENSIDTRTLLANALESVAQNEEEREKLAKYKSKIERANSLQFKLDAIRMQIKELNYLRDAEKIASLKKELKELEKKVDYYDRQLLRLEVTEPLKKIASRAWRNSKSKAVESYKDQIEKKAKVEGITQKALVLGKWLNKNSPKEHIIEPLKPAVAELVNAINFSSRQLLGKSGYPDVRGLPTNQDKDIAKALANLRDIAKNLDDAKKEAQAEESFLDQLDLPEFLLDELKNLTKVANALAEKYGKSSYILNEMSLKDLEVLDKVVTELKTICSTANESFAFSEKQKISELGDKFIASNDELSAKKMNNLATEYLEYDNSTPYYVFKRMGTVGRMMFDAFMDGQERYAFLADQIEKDSKDIFSEKEAEEWSQKTIEIRVLDTKTSKKNSPQYKTLQMTVAHAMSIYALSRREAAKPHLYGGGIRIKDFKLKHHINKITDAYGATLSKKEVEDIIGNLDSRQKEVAEKIQEYMSTKSAELGNYVTMKRWGIKQFTEKLYFPMETIKNGQNFDRLGSKDNSIYRLLNSSFTKALTPNANNKLVIDNIFDVFLAHTTDMAKYRSFALPMLDTIKILGYSKREATDLKGEENGHDELTVSSSIVNAFGEGGLKYIINLMKDLNSVETTPRGETIPKKLMSNYKVAAVGANLRVVLLQGTAYVKAAYNIEAKYLIKAMATNGKKASEKAMEHSGIALWKSKGNYDLNISRSVASRIKQEQSFAEKVKEKSLDLAGKADARTWGHLWKACEYWATDNTNFEKDSDKFYEAVSKRFREIIVSTQVVDSTLTRTQLMRSKSAMVQTMTAFMSEAAMTYNMLSDAFFEWGLDARREGKSYKSTFGKHGRKFARAAIVWSLTNVATSLAGAVVDAGRDDDDEKGLDEKYLMALLENLKDNFNPIGILPIFRDIKSIMEGFSPTRYDMQSFSTLYNAYKKWVKVIEGDGNVYQAAYKTIQGLSQASGMPFSNQIRDVKAMWNNSVGIVFPSLKFK